MEELKELKELVSKLQEKINKVENKLIDRKIEIQGVDGSIWNLFGEKYDKNKIQIIRGRAYLLDYSTMYDYPSNYPDAEVRCCEANEIDFTMNLSKKRYTVEIIEYYDNDGEYDYTDYDLL